MRPNASWNECTLGGSLCAGCFRLPSRSARPSKYGDSSMSRRAREWFSSDCAAVWSCETSTCRRFRNSLKKAIVSDGEFGRHAAE